MKTYLYNDLDHPDPIRIDERNILKLYWYYWCNKMKSIGKHSMISEENCISDWVTVNGAWEEK